MAETQDASRPTKVALFHGNCQAEALRMLFEEVPSFARAFEIVAIPAVHDLTADDLPAVRAAAERADVIVTQEIRDDYRDLPVGTAQLIGHAPKAHVVRVPALYSDATFPFQAYIRDEQGLPVDAPTTVYHDLRALAVAAAGLGPEDVAGVLARHVPPREVLKRIAEISDARMREVERASDIEIVDRITDPQARLGAFWAVNHPTLGTLDLIVTAIQEQLGLSPEFSKLRTDILGRFKTPVEQPVIGALGLQGFSSETWTVDDNAFRLETALAENVAFLRERTDLITTGLQDHSERLGALGLNPNQIKEWKTPTMPAKPTQEQPSATTETGWLKLPSRADATRDEIGVKPKSYLPIYEALLQPFRDRPIAILELGVWDGDSLMMWRSAFPDATIVGVDLNPPLRDLGPGITIAAGDQTDAGRLGELRREHAPGGFDVIIDDASHFGVETARTLQALYNEHLRPGGLYVIEDWGTGYLGQWHDGRPMARPLSVAGLDSATRQEDGSVEMPSHDIGVVGLVKRLVDHVARGTIGSLQPEQFEDALAIASMSVHDGVVALHKPA